MILRALGWFCDAGLEEPTARTFADHDYAPLLEAVKKHSGEVVGFAFLHPYHSASTLRRTAVITYFIMPKHTRKGLGTAILKRFVEEAQKLGVDTILASISSRNEESIRFHTKNGFQECGRFRKVGRKFGEDFDVVWMQLHLSDFGSEAVGSARGNNENTDDGDSAAID
ncbi:MAG: GNAT family N-acetyltransferase [Anaerolineae bacterium]